jgi:hypothetical protein
MLRLDFAAARAGDPPAATIAASRAICSSIQWSFAISRK